MAVSSPTYRAPYFFGLGFLFLEKGVPYFKQSIDGDMEMELCFASWCRGVELKAKVKSNDHAYMWQMACECHVTSAFCVNLV